MDEKLNTNKDDRDKLENTQKFENISITSPKIDLSSFSNYGPLESSKDEKNNLNSSNLINTTSGTMHGNSTSSSSIPKLSLDISDTLDLGLIASGCSGNSNSLIIYGNNYNENSPKKMGNCITLCFYKSEPLIVIGPNCNNTLLIK